MKKFVIMTLCLVFCSPVLASVPKVVLCHTPQCPEGDIHGNQPVTLEVAINAVPAHLAHGDTLGECGDEPVCIGCENGESCFVEQDGECAVITCAEETSAVICDGQDGANGNNGVDGTSCFVEQQENCALIVCGSSSAVVCDGEDGLPGQDGSSCTVQTVDECAEIMCDDGTSATVCNGLDGQNGVDGSSCTVLPDDNGALVVCDDGNSVLVENGVDLTGFDDDGDGVTNNIDQCPGTVNGDVDLVGCLIPECVDQPYDLFGGDGGDTSGYFCGICGSQCGLAMMMVIIGLGFMKRKYNG